MCLIICFPNFCVDPSEVSILRKERFNNWYRLKTYYAAMLVSDVPIQVSFLYIPRKTNVCASEMCRRISRGNLRVIIDFLILEKCEGLVFFLVSRIIEQSSRVLVAIFCPSGLHQADKVFCNNSAFRYLNVAFFPNNIS